MDARIFSQVSFVHDLRNHKNHKKPEWFSPYLKTGCSDDEIQCHRLGTECGNSQKFVTHNAPIRRKANAQRWNKSAEEKSKKGL